MSTFQLFFLLPSIFPQNYPWMNPITPTGYCMLFDSLVSVFKIFQIYQNLKYVKFLKVTFWKQSKQNTFFFTFFMSGFLVDHVKHVLASDYIFQKRVELKCIIRWMEYISVLEGAFLYLCEYTRWLSKCFLQILSSQATGSSKISGLWSQLKCFSVAILMKWQYVLIHD